jgi:hypothetical protein
VLDGHQDRPAPLTADAEALEDAQDDEQDRSPHADGLVGRQQTYEEGGDSHDQEREDQHRLAPDPIPEVAENNSAHGAGEEANGKRGEGRQRPGKRRKFREEELVEDQRRRRPV